MAILDEADYRILDILQKDGRITFSDLADQVNLSRSAVRERIKNMQDKMVIDYTYCKGCGICTAECPKKAIDFVLEADCVKEGK